MIHHPIANNEKQVLPYLIVVTVLHDFIFNILVENKEKAGKKANEFEEWLMPDLEWEQEEIADRAKDLGMEPADLEFALDEGQIVELDDETWEAMENTDSFEIESFSEAIHLAHVYRKNYRFVLNAYIEREPVPMPLVVTRKDGTPYLVAGNTRLMFARVLGIRPKVLIGRVPV